MACGYRCRKKHLANNSWPGYYHLFCALCSDVSLANWKNPFVRHLPLLKLIYCVHNYSREEVFHTLFFSIFSVYFATTIYSCKFLASKIESGKSVGWDGVCWHLTSLCRSHGRIFRNFMFYLVHFPLPAPFSYYNPPPLPVPHPSLPEPIIPRLSAPSPPSFFFGLLCVCTLHWHFSIIGFLSFDCTFTHFCCLLFIFAIGPAFLTFCTRLCLHHKISNVSIPCRISGMLGYVKKY